MLTRPVSKVCGAQPGLTSDTLCLWSSRSRPRLANKPCLVTYDRLYRVAGGIEGQSICIHARGAAGACRAGGSGCQAGGNTGRDA